MEKKVPVSYCEAIKNLDQLHVDYHNHAYGFPIHDDNQLFERLVLEINQAGLSWTTILKKADNFRIAYDRFNIEKVATYGERDINRLLNDAGIIRNRLKINAAIHNARVIREIQSETGSFENWLDQHHPMELKDWVKLFKKRFKFTGGEIINEFLMSTGYLPGAHIKTCPVYDKIRILKPKFLEK